MVSLVNRICCRLFKRGHPSLKYSGGGGGGEAGAQSHEPELPMPESMEELDRQFQAIVEELDLDSAHRDAMSHLPPDKKWQIICSRMKEREDPNSAQHPEFYIENLRSMANRHWPREAEEIGVRRQVTEDLRTALRTQPLG